MQALQDTLVQSTPSWNLHLYRLNDTYQLSSL
jgi:hypothetical protein